jgi:hypothetical protein
MVHSRWSIVDGQKFLIFFSQAQDTMDYGLSTMDLKTNPSFYKWVQLNKARQTSGFLQLV